MKKPSFIWLLYLSFFFSFFRESAAPLCASLSLDEKIGQLFVAPLMMPFERNKGLIARSCYTLNPTDISDIIASYHIGGVIFLGSSEPEYQKNLTDTFQSQSSIPLIIAQDLEWGLAMRHIDVIRYPRALTLAALPEDKKHLIYSMGKEIGKQCHTIGVNFNLAPVADVNVHPKNPVIGTRSFGDSPDHVVEHATLYMNGLTDAGILCCAKHFPGHGDTHTDSHYALPIIPHDRDRLNAVELAPFKSLINTGVPAIMTAHLHVPALDPCPSSIATLSPAIITNVLRTQLNFKGLILTDGLGMKAITNSYTPADVAIQAIKAGCDILLCALDIPASHAALKKAVLAGVISHEELDAHVERILRAKEWINNHKPAIAPPLSELHASGAKALARELYRSALTLCWGTVPAYTSFKTVHVLTLNNATNHCATLLKNKLSNVRIHSLTTSADLEQIHAEIMPEDAVIVCVYPHQRSAILELSGTASLEPLHLENCIKTVGRRTAHTTAVVFDTPYRLAECRGVATCILAYEDVQDAQEAAIDALLGLLKPAGHLPIPRF